MDMMEIRRRVLIGSRKKKKNILYHASNLMTISSEIDTGVQLFVEDNDFTICYDYQLNINEPLRNHVVRFIDLKRSGTKQDSFVIEHYVNLWQVYLSGSRAYIYFNEAYPDLGGNAMLGRKRFVFRYSANDFEKSEFRVGNFERKLSGNHIYTPYEETVKIGTVINIPFTLYDVTIYGEYLDDREVDKYIANGII